MAIIYPYAMPDVLAAKECLWTEVDVSVGVMSRFTGSTQEQAMEGQWWECDITLPAMYDRNARPWSAWFSAMKGRVGTTLYCDPRYEVPAGDGGGAPVVFGADQTGDILEITGAPINKTAWLKANDRFHLGSGLGTRLHKVVSDVATDGSGRATMDIWPRLRESPADAAPITINMPSGLFRLVSPRRQYQTNASGIWPEYSFVMMEVVGDVGP